MADDRTPIGTAVVIGGSICGSSTASALAHHFERVIVVDRDEEPKGPGRRHGAPHAHQFHSLTAGGRLDLEALFPGLTDDLIARGVPFDDPMDTKLLSKFGWVTFPESSPMRKLHATRTTLEHYVRGRAEALGNVEFRWRVGGVGLQVEKGRVVGLRVENLDDKTSAVIAADLVVDASGRASKAPEWLEANGFPKPQETVVNARWGYATVYVRVPDGWDPGYHALYIGPTVTGQGRSATRGAAMWRQEDDLVVVTAQGCAGDLPPADFDGHLEYLSSFGTTYFKDFVEKYGAVTKLETWRNTSNRQRDYAGMPLRPENFIVLGDAAAAFNPIYGQGMTVAARGALTLDAELSRFLSERGTESNLDGFAEQFQSKLKQVVDPCWAFSTVADYSVPGVELNGVRHEVARTPESEYNDRVLALATEDPQVALMFSETLHMVRSPAWLAEEGLRQRIMDNWDRLGQLKRDETITI